MTFLVCYVKTKTCEFGFQVVALNTDKFILWHRDWKKDATVSDEHLKELEVY